MSSEEADALGLESYLGGDGVCLIEWAERAEQFLPEGTIRIRLSVEGTGRRIQIDGLKSA
jgi:tRNA threonylcarbamoyladenosine biosynthesis protein TsaE